MEDYIVREQIKYGAMYNECMLMRFNKCKNNWTLSSKRCCALSLSLDYMYLQSGPALAFLRP